jgi:hypothetical protein
MGGAGGDEALVHCREGARGRGRTLQKRRGQATLAELFQTTKQSIRLHLQNILDEKELQPAAVVKEYLTTASDGKRYRADHGACNHAPYRTLKHLR